MTANSAEFVTDESKELHMGNAVQSDPDLFQVAFLEDTFLHEDPAEVYDYLTYLQGIRNPPDNCDAFSRASGGKISARKVYTHELDDPMTQVFAHSRLNNCGQVRMDIATWESITPLGQQLWHQVSEEDKA